MGIKDKLANIDVSGLTSVFKRDDDGENDGLRGGKGGGAHSGLGYTKDGGLNRGPWQRFDSGDGSSSDGGVGMLLYLTRGSQVSGVMWSALRTSVNPRASRPLLGARAPSFAGYGGLTDKRIPHIIPRSSASWSPSSLTRTCSRPRRSGMWVLAVWSCSHVSPHCA